MSLRPSLRLIPSRPVDTLDLLNDFNQHDPESRPTALDQTLAAQRRAQEEPTPADRIPPGAA